MQFNKNLTVLGVALTLFPLAVMAALPGHDKRDFTEVFTCPGDSFVNSTAGGAVNQYFPLTVGSVSYLSNKACVDDGECEELEEVWITVTNDTVTVGVVETRVVEEREMVDGELDEISRNFFAECLGSGDVFYFGEDVVDGDGNPLPDGWRAGDVPPPDCDDGEVARPGLIMPGGTFILGARYFQEVAPCVALDRGEHADMGLSVENPDGGANFEGCVQVNDTNALEDPKGKEFDEKVYCPGIGIVRDEDAMLSIDPSL